MTSATMTLDYIPLKLLPSYLTTGTSSNTNQPRSVDEKTLVAFGQSGYSKLVDYLQTELKEYSAKDWDGYDAYPIDQRAIVNCAAFLTRLQDVDIFTPSVEPEADGKVTLEWYINPSNLLQISFGASENASYAYLLDGDGHCGDLGINKKFRETIKAIFHEINGIARIVTDRP